MAATMRLMTCMNNNKCTVKVIQEHPIQQNQNHMEDIAKAIVFKQAKCVHGNIPDLEKDCGAGIILLLEKRATIKIVLVYVPHCSINKGVESGELWEQE